MAIANEIEADIREGDEFVEKLRAGRPSIFGRLGNGMPRTLRFHLDENVSRAIAQGLRKCGVDVTTTPEVDLLEAPDEQQLAHVLRAGRVLFTQDRRFPSTPCRRLPLILGIAYCDKDTLSIGRIIEGLVLIWEIYEPEDMASQDEALSDLQSPIWKSPARRIQ